MSAARSRAVLYSDDRPGAARTIHARIDDGGFTVETGDAGDDVAAVWGGDDYAFWTTVPREARGDLLPALSAEFLADDP